MGKYDVVIIGAGIGGLTCGCYLAKAGLKVLIAEQQAQPGGCCVSFKRKGYTFDAGAHSLDSLGEGGITSEILKDLGLKNRIQFIRKDIIDRIILPDAAVLIKNDKEGTKKELILHFPKEKNNINKFFNFLGNNNTLYIISKTKKITFQELLDSFFDDHKLKTVLSVLLANLGLSPAKASALASAFLYKGLIFDGGYYPKGGIQILPDLLASRFKECGGELLLSTKATKIVTKERKARGVELKNNEFISSKFVVSNADATLTFTELLDCSSEESKKITKLYPSVSAFVLYLGLNKKINIRPEHLNTWCLSAYDLEESYKYSQDLFNLTNFGFYLCCFSSLVDPSLAPIGKSVVRLLAIAKFADKNIWERHKDAIAEKFINKAENIIPGLQDMIEVQEIATPQTFYKWTSNREGALFGWSAIPIQIDRNVFSSRTSIHNLFLTGHWVCNGLGQSGVSLAALCGRDTAKIIKNNNKI